MSAGDGFNFMLGMLAALGFIISGCAIAFGVFYLIATIVVKLTELPSWFIERKLAKERRAKEAAEIAAFRKENF